MKLLIDIGHPAHVHLFKHFAWLMQKKGNKVLFTVRDKENEVFLLKKYGFDYKLIGKHYNNKLGKLFGLFWIDLKLLKESMSFKPDLFLSHGSFYNAQVGWVLRKPIVTLEDTGNMEQIRLYLPFTSVVLTSIAFNKNLGSKQLFYNGYHELAYLHSNRFKPDKGIRDLIGVGKNEKMVILRFVSWNATHDEGEQGLSLENKRSIISSITKEARILISSEKELEQEFEQFRLSISPEMIHDVLAEADLFIGEGATMASECSMLGTPAIYINSINAGTIQDQETQGLLFHFKKFDGVLDKALEILNNPKSGEEFKLKRDRMLFDKIDVTAFLFWFIENFPGSHKILKENPAFQENFR